MKNEKELLLQIEKLTTERDEYKKHYNKCHDCPIVCVKTEYLRLLDKVEKLEAQLEGMKP